MKINLFTNKEEKIDGNWYKPYEYLRDIPSVVKAELLDTCSSAGDWNGYFIQRKYNTFFLIPFSQKNNYPRSGFTLNTGEVFASWKGNITKEDLNLLVSEYCQFYYN